ncbi:MAG TPA: hypothetical protein VN026_00375 [Bacteroidia bacterium]|jgi:hypothetical protein|nr:hypothetical protein [Bacteroidia bacterium]
MSVSDWIATTGVSILLLGFGLNLLKIISADSYLYLSLNFIGALLAGFASVLINFIPFVILESVWTFVSLFAIIKKINDRKKTVNE